MGRERGGDRIPNPSPSLLHPLPLTPHPPPLVWRFRWLATSWQWPHLPRPHLTHLACAERSAGLCLEALGDTGRGEALANGSDPPPRGGCPRGGIASIETLGIRYPSSF